MTWLRTGRMRFDPQSKPVPVLADWNKGPGRLVIVTWLSGRYPVLELW